MYRRMAGPSGGEEKPRTIITSSGYCFSSSENPSNIQTHFLQSFEQNPEIYNLTAGMETIGFPSKSSSNNSSIFRKEFFNNKQPMNEPTTDHQFYHQDLTGISDSTNESLMVSPDTSSWNHQSRLLVDDPSLRCSVFPCEGTERPSQGLSLSLSPSNPSSISLQSFELRQHEHDLMRFGPSSSRSVNIQPQNQTEVMMMQEQQQQQQQFQFRNSKYLGPAQDLLYEFCNLGTQKNDDTTFSKMKGQEIDEWNQNENAMKKNSSLYSLDLLELQKRKSKLLQMLEEVERRYKRYCDQMKAVVQSFEAVTGTGAATVYSALASRAMSRHFRCLKDGIVGQIKATKKAIEEKDTAAPGTIKGETPRLRLLDQTLRQQRAFQQMNMMETHPWRPQRGLPERSVSVLRAWLFEHFLHPYPSDVDKHILARQTGLSRSQVSNWFINARVRLWKPMVEEMYLEELKEHEGALDGGAAAGELQNQNPARNEDQKPTHDQLLRIDSECLSSIINNSPAARTDGRKNKAAVQNDGVFGRVGDSFGAMELDFSSYSTAHHSVAAAASVSYVNANNAAHNYGGGGNGGVSLTLGLHQHNATGVSLAFSSASQSSLFYPRDHMEDCQTVQYSLLDGENQNLPYRNLMGAQLLHDLTG